MKRTFLVITLLLLSQNSMAGAVENWVKAFAQARDMDCNYYSSSVLDSRGQYNVVFRCSGYDGNGYLTLDVQAHGTSSAQHQVVRQRWEKVR